MGGITHFDLDARETGAGRTMQVPKDSSLPGTLKGAAAGRVTKVPDDSGEAGRSRKAAGTRSRRGANRESEHDRKIEQLEASNAALREALATVAHELRTPLASIVAYNDLLLRNRSCSLSKKELEQLTIIRRNAGLLDFLVQDLAEMARMSSGALPIRAGVFDVSEMIQEVCESVRPFFDANRQTLNILLPPTDTWVNGDSVRLQQVVANLLTNASKFSPPASQIDIAAEVDSSKMMVQVVDRGIGIDREDHGKLFSSFFRTGDRASDGLGLGLYIAQSIVEAHGGEMSVKSRKGRGTTMSFTIPRLGFATPGNAARKSGLKTSPA